MQWESQQTIVKYCKNIENKNIQRLPGEFVNERLQVQTHVALWHRHEGEKKEDTLEWLKEARCRHAEHKEG